jgi:hypothetical protein
MHGETVERICSVAVGYTEAQRASTDTLRIVLFQVTRFQIHAIFMEQHF